MNLSIGLSLTRPSGPLGFNPASLFASGEEGAWYDPSDLTTVWQDAAGTTPATAGDPVGRIDDKSGNGNHATQATPTARPTLQVTGTTPATLGSELVTNGTFDSDVSGWSFQANATGSAVGGEMEVTLSATSSRSAYQDITTVTGKWYLITLTARSASGEITAGAYSTGFGSLATETKAVSGSDVSFSILYNATVSTTRILVSQSATGSSETYYVDNVSVKEVLTWADPKYYLDFDGMDDRIIGPTFSSPIAQPVTWSFGWKFDVFNVQQFDIVIDSTVGDPDRLTFTDDNGNIKFQGQSITASNTNSNIATLHFNTTDSEARINGSSVVSSVDVGLNNWGGINLGSNFAGSNWWLNGRIYGFIGVDRTLTASEISNVESYMAAKSGVTI